MGQNTFSDKGDWKHMEHDLSEEMQHATVPLVFRMFHSMFDDNGWHLEIYHYTSKYFIECTTDMWWICKTL